MSCINFYKVIPRHYLPEHQSYASYEKIRIDLPFRMLIVGQTGSGKTNLLLNIIQNINAWTKIWLIAKNLEEPLYQFFQDAIAEVERKARTQVLTVGNSIEEIPDVDSFDKHENNLLILDDLISEKESKLSNISAIFVRGRKQNLSTIFISQSYFKIPLLIRQNSEYIILKKISGKRDLQRIVSDFALEESPEQLMHWYAQSTKSLTDFFMIDTKASDPRWRFRHNYEPIRS